jgi:hypothetical protein
MPETVRWNSSCSSQKKERGRLERVGGALKTRIHIRRVPEEQIMLCECGIPNDLAEAEGEIRQLPYPDAKDSHRFCQRCANQAIKEGIKLFNA